MRYVQLSVCVPCGTGSWWGHAIACAPDNKAGWDKLTGLVGDAVRTRLASLGADVDGTWSMYLECTDPDEEFRFGAWYACLLHRFYNKLGWKWEFIPDTRPECDVDHPWEGGPHGK